ncbi:ribonuclease H-like domain-containing protein, partial [Tanacetum coccineum]
DASGNVFENVLHSFVAESDPQQQITYEDFDQIGKFEKKAGRKFKFNNKDAARFDRKKVRCYQCSELRHFARECTWKKVDSKTSEDMEKGASEVYGMIAGYRDDTIIPIGDAADGGGRDSSSADGVFVAAANDSDGVFVAVGVGADGVSVTSSDAIDAETQFALMRLSPQLVIEEKLRILTADQGNTTNMLKYTENLNDQLKLEKLETQDKLEEFEARFDKWMESSKNLHKLINSSVSTRTKFGLGYGETFRSDEVFDPSAPSIFDSTPEDVEGIHLYDRFDKVVGMHAVPPPLTGTFMPPSNRPDIDDTQFT